MRRRELLAGTLPRSLLAQGTAARRRAADAIQTAVREEAPHVPLGQFFQPAAMRDVTGVLDSPFPIFWNARKG